MIHAQEHVVQMRIVKLLTIYQHAHAVLDIQEIHLDSVQLYNQIFLDVSPLLTSGCSSLTSLFFNEFILLYSTSKSMYAITLWP